MGTCKRGENCHFLSMIVQELLAIGKTGAGSGAAQAEAVARAAARRPTPVGAHLLILLVSALKAMRTLDLLPHQQRMAQRRPPPANAQALMRASTP